MTTELKLASRRIPATTYLRPTGLPVPCGLYAIEDETHRRAMSLIDLGYRFTLEVLTTGETSLAIEGPVPGDDDEEADIGIVVFRTSDTTIAKQLPVVIRQVESALESVEPSETDQGLIPSPDGYNEQ